VVGKKIYVLQGQGMGLLHCLVQRGHGKRLCKKDCQARNLNKEDAMDRGRWKKLIKTG